MKFFRAAPLGLFNEPPPSSDSVERPTFTFEFRRDGLPAGHRLAFCVFLAILAAPFTSVAQPVLAPGEVLIERTILPDAHASSFAFGLPGGISFCYDPTRGGLNYAWTGGFIDLTNVRPINKLVKPATLIGAVVYREAGAAPLRRGDATRVPVIEFKGYTLRNAAVELRYTVDGVPVTEEIRARPAGDGLVRQFRFDRAGADAKWFYVVEGRPATTLTKDAAGVVTVDVPFASPAP
jgi:hypothetical protein